MDGSKKYMDWWDWIKEGHEHSHGSVYTFQADILNDSVWGEVNSEDQDLEDNERRQVTTSTMMLIIFSET
jgi:hypothetical protein